MSPSADSSWTTTSGADAVDVETAAYARVAARDRVLGASRILGDEQPERAAALVTERAPAPVLGSLVSWTRASRTRRASRG